MKPIKASQKTITPRQATEIYGLSMGTLANLRCQRKGPKFFKVGRKILYPVADFEEWITRNPVLTIDSIRTEEGGRNHVLS